MNWNDSIKITKFPKSNNHRIIWKKNDNIKTCNLNSNCSEIIFDIKQNKKNKNYELFNQNKKTLLELSSLSYIILLLYNILPIIIFIILIMIIVNIVKK